MMPRTNASYVITPDAFSVHPSLVGQPLARPARRLAAMLLDLLLVAIVVQSAGATLLGLAAAWFAFRAAGRLTGTAMRPGGRMMRFGVRAFGALILFLVASSAWKNATGLAKSALRQRVEVAASGAGAQVGTELSALQALGLGAEIVALQTTRDEAEARRMMGQVVAGFRAGGMDEADIADSLDELFQDQPAEREAWLDGIAKDALAPPAAARPAAAPAVPPDSLARLYAAAVAAGDTAAAGALRPRLASALARDSLDHLRGELREAREDEKAVAGRLKEVEDRGLLSSLLHFLDDLGIGFGWTGLYFTAFVAVWKGQTPAKRLLGVRVVRLDGRPMTWWTSFERFGGYAAGLVTGLLGFAQVYWDRNRQMIHDKIVETVVIRDSGRAPEVPATAAPSAAAPYGPTRHTDPPA